MRYAVGIDLHGTLIEDREIIRPELLGRLKTSLEAARSTCRLYVCTGNDLTFVRRKIPREVLELFDGYILEIGCVFGSLGEEKVLIDEKTRLEMRELEARLKAYNDPQVYKFARRAAIISIFTRYGCRPEDYKKVIEDRLRALGYEDTVYAAYSSVAVDITPRGFDKYRGLARVSDGLTTVGVADTMNDVQLHLGSDMSFAPSNIGQELKEKLLESGRELVALRDARELKEGVTYIAGKPVTEGVIEILERLAGS